MGDIIGGVLLATATACGLGFVLSGDGATHCGPCFGACKAAAKAPAEPGRLPLTLRPAPAPKPDGAVVPAGYVAPLVGAKSKY